MNAWGKRVPTILIALAVCLLAEPAGADETAESLRYRRIFVRDSQIREGHIAALAEGYLPIKRSEFEALVAPDRGDRPRLQTVTLTANFDGQRTLSGTAVLDVVAPEGIFALPLDPLNLAVVEPTWQGSKLEPVRIGLAPDGTTVAMVPASGQLQFGWSLVGKPTAPDDVVFPIRLPPAATHRLLLQLPVGRVPTTDVGLIRLLPLETGTAEDKTLASWQIDLGGSASANLVIRSQRAVSPQNVRVKQRADYELRETGISASGEIRLDVVGAPLRQLQLKIDPRLSLISAKFGDLDLEFAEQADGAGTPTTLIYLPNSFVGTDRRVRWTAFASLPLGSSFALPTVTVQNAFWEEAELKVRVNEPLELAELELHGLEQSSVSMLPANAGEELRFRQFRQDSQTVLRLTRRAEQPSARSGLAVRVGRQDINAIGKLVLTSLGENPVQLQTNAGGWSIQSVAAEPTSAIKSWSVVEEGGRRWLRIQLQPPPDETESIQLTIQAQRPTLGGDVAMSGEALQLLDFQDVRQERALVAVSTVASSQLIVRRDADALRVDARKLPEADASLLATDAAAIVFDARVNIAPIEIALEDKFPRIQGELSLVANVMESLQPDRLQVIQQFGLRCIPLQSQLSQLRVRFSEPFTGAVTWGFAGERDTLLSAQRASDSRSNEWIVQLPRPRSQPFEIEVIHVADLQESCKLPLPSLPDAQDQTGRVAVQAAPNVTLAIEALDVHAIPREFASPDQLPTERAAYRYAPSNPGMVQLQHAGDSAAEAGYWIRHCDGEIQVAADGSMQCSLDLTIESCHSRVMPVRLPAGARLLRMDSDGLTQPVTRGEGGVVVIPLSKTQRITPVHLEYQIRGRSLGNSGTVECHVPSIDAPVFDGALQLKLPPGYVVETALHLDWRERLLGPLDRRKTGHLWLGETAEQVGGWTTFNVPLETLNATSAKTLNYTRLMFVQASSWAWLITVFAFTWWAGAYLGRRAFVLPALVALTALAVPDPIAPWVTATFLGTLCGVVVFHLQQPWSSANAGPESDDRSKLSSAASATMLLLAVAVTSATTAWGQEHSEATDANSGHLHSVFLPVDENLQPVGDYVYVPRTLFDALRRRETSRDQLAKGYLISQADYVCRLEREADSPRFLVNRLEATFAIHVLKSSLRLPIPMAQEWQIEGLVFDGQNIDLSQGLPAHIPVGQPGRYELRLVITPPASADGEESDTDLKLAIPRVSQSTITVTAPTELRYVELISEAPQMLTRADDAFRAQLGPQEELHLEWPSAGSAAMMATRNELAVEQFVHVTVQPAAVRVDARFVLSSPVPVSEFRFWTDRQLRLLPFANELPIADYSVTQGDVQTVNVSLNPVGPEPVSFTASFVVNRDSGLGQLTIPQVKAISGRIKRDWLAVSASETLVLEPFYVRPSARVAEGEFVAAWGKPIVTPIPLVYDRGQQPMTEEIVTCSPVMPATTYQALTKVNIAADHWRVQWIADLQTKHGRIFQQQIQVPAGTVVEEVEVEKNDAIQTASWSRREETLTVHFDRPLTDDYRLRLHATGNVALGKKQTIPVFQLVDAPVQENQFQLFRTSGVDVSLILPPGYVVDPDADTTAYLPFLGRLQSAFKAPMPRAGDDSRRWPTIVVRANRPETSAAFVTSLVRREESWYANGDLNLSIRNGYLDQIRLEIPAEWKPPFVIVPELEFKVQEIPNSSRRYLELQLPRSVRDTYHVNIQGSLVAPEGEGLRAPDITLPDIDNVRRYLVTPTQVELRKIAWETSGLTPEPLPPDYVGGGISGPFMSYRVDSHQFHAHIQNVERVYGQPRIALADIDVAVNEKGYFGSATFDLEPADLQAGTFQLAESLRLVHVSVEGVPVTPLAVGKHWQVPLGAAHLPQRIRIVYSGELLNDQLLAPEFMDTEVKQTLWSITYQRGDAARSFGDEARATELQLARLRAVSGLIAESSDLVSEHAPRDVANWYRPWLLRLNESRQWLLHHPASDAISDSLEAMEAQQEDVARRLGTTRILTQVFAAQQPDTAHAAPYPQQFAIAARWLPAQNLELPERHEPPARSALGVVVVLIGAVSVYVLSRFSSVADSLIAWPQAYGVLGGMLWVALLNPPWLGWTLVLLSVGSSLRSPWHAPAPRRSNG